VKGTVAGLLPLTDQVQDAVPAHLLGVVLDAYCGGLGGTECVDAE
jgi:hypothetical protein